MKRSGPLKRTKPLPRSTKPLKRTRINPISKTERKERASNAKWHEQYRRDFPACQCGECGLPAEQLHEIGAGSSRRACRRLRCAVLHVASGCHRRIQSEPYARGLFRKLEADPEGFNLGEFNVATGRVATAITIDDVLAEGEMMGKQFKTKSEAQQDYLDLCRKCELLRRRLNEEETKRHYAANEVAKAHAREQKIADARRLVKDE